MSLVNVMKWSFDYILQNIILLTLGYIYLKSAKTLAVW